MTLQDILQAIQTLPKTDMILLRQQVLDAPQTAEPIQGTMDVDKLLKVLAEIRAELTDDQLDGIITDMNEDYFDDDDNGHG
jgi:hypothetical protein